MIPALSIRQPWAWLIVHGHKDVEKRDWPTNFRGRMLVHAGKTMTRKFYDQTRAELEAAGLLPADFPAFEDLPRGGLVGWVRVVDCCDEHPSPWKLEGHHAFVLREPVAMNFTPFQGKLGFFNVPEKAVAEQESA